MGQETTHLFGGNESSSFPHNALDITLSMRDQEITGRETSLFLVKNTPAFLLCLGHQSLIMCTNCEKSFSHTVGNCVLCSYSPTVHKKQSSSSRKGVSHLRRMLLNRFSENCTEICTSVRPSLRDGKIRLSVRHIVHA